jgi:hypothetical protein
VTFAEAGPLLFVTEHYASMIDIEQRFFIPRPWLFQTKTGPVTINRPDVDFVVIQKVSGSRILEHKTIVFNKEDIKMAEEEVKQVVAEVVNENEELPKQETTSTGLVVPSTYHKFMSFREALVGGRAEGESWEESIVTKQKAYNGLLKEIDSEITQRNIDAQKLKDSIVGK